jgi:hypothetical protein
LRIRVLHQHPNERRNHGAIHQVTVVRQSQAFCSGQDSCEIDLLGHHSDPSHIYGSLATNQMDLTYFLIRMHAAGYTANPPLLAYFRSGVHCSSSFLCRRRPHSSARLPSTLALHSDHPSTLPSPPAPYIPATSFTLSALCYPSRLLPSTSHYQIRAHSVLYPTTSDTNSPLTNSTPPHSQHAFKARKRRHEQELCEKIKAVEEANAELRNQNEKLMQGFGLGLLSSNTSRAVDRSVAAAATLILSSSSGRAGREGESGEGTQEEKGQEEDTRKVKVVNGVAETVEQESCGEADKVFVQDQSRKVRRKGKEREA